MPDEIRFVEVLKWVEVEGQDVPVEILEHDPAHKVTHYKTLIPVLTHLGEGKSEVCATGFDFCMN